LAEVGGGVGLGIRLRMERHGLGGAGVCGVDGEDAGALAVWVDHELGREAALVAVVIDGAMAAGVEDEEAEAHDGLCAVRAGGIGRERLPGSAAAARRSTFPQANCA